MYRIIRKIHLYTSFIITAFLLMYFITGAVMISYEIFPRKDIKNVTEKVTINSSQTEQEVLQEVCQKFNIYGERTSSRRNSGNKNYNFFRPGYRADVLFPAQGNIVTVRIREGTFASVMNDFHRIRGYKGSWTHIVWSFLYDLSCIALLVFALTGVYMWWKLERKKLTGVLFLLASTGITAFTIWYVMWVS